MKHWRWRPGGLYWRLAVSYFLVTLVAVLTVEVATLGLPLIQQVQQFSNSLPLDQRLATEKAPLVAPYLQQARLNRSALENEVLIPLLYGIDKDAPSQVPLVAVLNHSGQVVAAVACPWSQAADLPTSVCSAVTADALTQELGGLPLQKSIEAARTGAERSVARIRDPLGDGFAIIVPVLDPAGQSLGVLVTILRGGVTLRVPLTAGDTGLAALGDIAGTVVNRIQPAGFAFLLLATGIGTLAGMVISRNLTRRLRHITQATDAWSRGEFGVAVHDPARDEVGQLARDLNRMAAQIQALLTTREQLAVVEERNRLARELHDSVKQQVFAGALLVRAAHKLLPRDPQTAQQHLVEAEALASQTQQELIGLIAALRPAALADQGLGAVLRAHVGDWSRRMGIAATVRITGERATPLEIEDTLFRVAQEALANVARHSGAQAVEAGLAWTDLEVCLTVRDDGQGFNPAQAATGGQGLGNMRARVEALGGCLVLTSAPGDTRLVASVPLAAPPAAIGQGVR